ncbi:MAG: ATP-binding cassette domain-containing protein [Spirochaetia bacterium]|jgi:ABC-type transporter Mla maintaining outer membrane lipid asymmetry ATPase subunit MlaF
MMEETPRTAPRETSLIHLRDVSVNLGGRDVLRNVELSFLPGRSTVIMGPSGSGKSTLLKIAAGLIPPDSGKVFFRGKDMFLLSEGGMKELRKASGFVFQDGALWENKTLVENLALPLEVHFPELHPAEVERRVVRSLEKGGIVESASKRPAALSGGEKKIASFLRAIITEPSILFMDEPTLSIDHTMEGKVAQIIGDLKGRGCAIIAVTHDPQLSSTLADQLVVLDGGTVRETGDFDTVKRSRDVRTREILAEVLGEIASYDTDLLALLGAEGEEGT